jgi:hypothetical protein
MTITVCTALLLMAGLWSVLCRVNQMQRGVTDPAVFGSHLVIGLGLAGGLFLPGEAGKFALALGVAVYLLAGAWRWRYAAPPGTRLDSAHGELQERAPS